MRHGKTAAAGPPAGAPEGGCAGLADARLDGVSLGGTCAAGAGDNADATAAGGTVADATERRLVAQTARFTGSFVRWMEDRTCDGLSLSRLRLLQALRRSGPAIMRDLAGQLGATPRNMTAHVDALEEAGLVARRAHPTDRRATMIELTVAGAREVDQELGPRLDAMSEIFAELSEPEREQYAALLGKLMRAIRARLPDC